MRSAESEPTVSATIQPAESADSQFEVARRELRLALIQAIARRVGKSLGVAGGGMGAVGDGRGGAGIPRWTALQRDFTEASYTVLRPRGMPNPEIRLMMTEIEVRREIFHLITEYRKGYSFAEPRIVKDEDADELSWQLFYRMKAKDLLKVDKVDDD